MKKVLTSILSLALCLLFIVSSPLCTLATEADSTSKENFTDLGQDIVLDFAKISFSSVNFSYSIGNTIRSIAKDGTKFLCLNGKIENTDGANLPVDNVLAEMVINGKYTYTGRATILNTNNTKIALAPLMEDDYTLYAEIPEKLVDQISTCEIQFSINDKFATMPQTAEKADHTYRFLLTKEAGDFDSTNELQYFFEECPILPTPENYAVLLKAWSSSNFNGTQSISYTYSAGFGRNDQMDTVYETYIAGLEQAGFTIQNSTGSGCDIYTSGKKLASVTCSTSQIKFSIVPGNEKIEAPVPNKPTVAETKSEESIPSFKIGDTIKTDYVQLTLDEYYSDSEIRSASSQYGMYHYYQSEDGNPYFILKGKFKNLGSVPVNIWNTSIQFCFDGKYNYKGDLEGVSPSASDFIHEIAPLAEIEYYMYVAVPQSLIDSFKTCDITLGFTKNFNHKILDVNGLPIFDSCDDIFSICINK